MWLPAVEAGCDAQEAVRAFPPPNVDIASSNAAALSVLSSYGAGPICFETPRRRVMHD